MWHVSPESKIKFVNCELPPKYNEKRRKQVSFNEKVNRACDNNKNNSNEEIYAYMTHMSSNDECPSEILVAVCN